MRYVFSLVPSSCFCFSSTTLSVYNDACVHFVCYFYDSEQFTIKLQKWSSGATLSLIIHCLPSTFLLTSTWSWCISPETLHLDPMHEAQGSVTLWRSVITITFHSVCTWAQFYLLCHYAKALWANTPSWLSHVCFKPSTVAQLHGLAKHQSTLIFVLQWCCLCRCGSPCHVCTDIISSIPSSERAVGDRERMLDLLQRWGQHRAEVRFFLRHNRAPRESGKLPSSLFFFFPLRAHKGFFSFSEGSL